MLLHKANNSTIFQTKNNELAIFGKTLEEVQTKAINFFDTFEQYGLKGENGAFASLFNLNDSKLIADENLIKELSFDEAKKQLAIFNDEVVNGKTKLEDFFKKYENYDGVLRKYVTTTSQQSQSVQGLVKASQDARAAQIAHNEQVKAGTIGAKAATVATKALSMALNIAASMLITWAIQKAVEWIDELAHSAENCKERVDELVSSYESALDSANSNAQAVENLAERYKELSKGVDGLGQNVSLTSDEFAEYNDLNNQIADMFPELIQGYTAEGNAILSLKGNVEALRDAYKEAQQEAYNSLIANGEDGDGNDIIENFKNTQYNDKIFRASLFSQEYIDAVKTLQQAMLDGEEAYETAYSELFSNLSSAQNKELRSTLSEIGFISSDLSEVDKRSVQANANAYVQTWQAEVDSALSNVQSLANAYLMTNEDYSKLGEDAKSALSLIVNSINADIAKNFENKTDVGKYVDELVTGVKDNPELSNALIDLFTVDLSDLSVDEAQAIIDKNISKISSILDEDENQLKIRLGFTTYDDAETAKNKVKELLSSDEFYGKIGELSLGDLEIASALEITDGTLLTWDELIAKIEEAKNAVDDDSFSSFMDMWESSDFADTKEELLELAKAGKITADVLESTKEYNELLSKTGLTAEEAKDKITNMLSAQEKLAAAHTGLDSLSSAFDEFKDIGFVTAQTLESLPDVFKELSGWDIFSSIAGNGKSTASEVQQAFNDIVKQYLIAQNTFSGLINASETEIQSYISNLKQMGVTNAEEVVNQARNALEEQNNLLAAAEEEAYEGYVKYLESKSDAELAFLEDSGSKNGQLVAALGSAYQQDYQNWQSLLSKKAEAYNAFVNALGGAYNKSLSLAQNIQKNKKQTVVGFNELAAADAAQAQYEEIEYQLKKATQALQLDLSTIDTNFGSSFSPSYSGTRGTSNKKSKEETEESFNWIERVLKKVQRTITNLGKTVAATYKSWTTRNNALAQQISAVNSEISTQQKAYDYYMKKAESLGLSSSYVNKIKNGTISIETITNESLIKKIQEYQDLYDQACDAQDAIIDLKDELASLSRTKFDNVVSEYDSQISEIEHRANMLEAYLDQTEARGYLLSAKYYESLREAEKEKIAALQNEYSALTAQLEESMKTGNIEEGSEEWYSMKEEINGVEEAIVEANTALIEFNNSIRELEWEVFDFLQDSISAVTDETQFLIDLMSSKDLFDEKGNLTDEGMATMGLHGQNYNVYMSQADQYEKEIEKLNKELEADPNNTDLIERREELLELQRESILAAEDEKQAIVDLVTEGIEKELDALQDLIDKYNEALDSAKDLRDYQKKIQDLNEETATLEKQEIAYAGDDSEESKAKIQQIKVELEEARENLEEAEYEHYISEQKKLLDELYSEYEMLLNSRLDDIDALLSNMIDTINANASNIDETLRTESEKVGYTMTDSLQDIWSNEGCASTIISKYGDGFLEQMTSVNNVLNAIAKKIGAMTEESDAKAEETIKQETAKTETKPSTSTSTSTSSTSSTTTTTKTISVGGKINAGSAKIYDYAGDTTGETQYYKNDPIYTVLAEKSGYLKVRHHKLSSGTTGWFKKSDVKAYKTGGYVDYTGLAWVDGKKTNPESFLDAEDTERLGELTDTLKKVDVSKLTLTQEQIKQFQDSYRSNMEELAKFNPEHLSNMSSNTTYGDINISIPIERVLDYNDFCNQLSKDDKFEKLIQSMTTDRLAGGSKLAKNKFRW